jgi:hypothetical protein
MSCVFRLFLYAMWNGNGIASARWIPLPNGEADAGLAELVAHMQHHRLERRRF